MAISESPVVWSSKLDDRYQCWVTRLGERHGILKVIDGDETILEEIVGFSYGAEFGPDPDDVMDWANRIMDVIVERNGSAEAQN